MENGATRWQDSQTGHDDISPNTGGTETHFELSSLMGHFQPTPQNSCRAQSVIMMPLPVTECVSVFVVILLSLCVINISLSLCVLRSSCTIAPRCLRSHCCSSEGTSQSRRTGTRRPWRWTSGSSLDPQHGSLTLSRQAKDPLTSTNRRYDNIRSTYLHFLSLFFFNRA